MTTLNTAGVQDADTENPEQVKPLESMEPALSHGHTIMTRREFAIVVADVLVMLALLKFLPYKFETNAGLALLVFAGVLWLTEAIHITLTALIVPVLAVTFGLMDMEKSLQSFSDPTIFLFFGGFVLATAFHVQGIDRLIANRVLLLARGNFGAAAVLMFVATAALSMWISNTATAAMMLPLALGILSNLDTGKERNTFVFLLLGVAYSASIGGLGTPVGSPPNMITINYLKTIGIEIDFVGWMKYGIPLTLIMMVVMVGVLYCVFRPNFAHRVEIEKLHFTWTRPRVIAVAVFLAAALCWIFSSQLSGFVGGKQFDSYVAVAAAVLVGVSGVASWKQIQMNTEWGVLLLFGGGLALSSILKISGASVVMAQAVSGVLGDGHWFIVMVTSVAFIILLT
ncbi:MAG: DASS family sodium-coupled anion symporter, partial [Zoogloeaceae bacterium]|nr:DASS family sodium-coupled anion symporter [Zoogloeaceae bacterium]